MNKTSYPSQKGSDLRPSLSKARLGLDIEPRDFYESPDQLADMKGYLFFPNRSRPKVSQVNLRKTNDTSKSPEDDRYKLLQGSNNTSMGESSIFGFQTTCESQRKPTQKLAYTNKLKNQRKLNEIYSSERLTTNTHFFSFGLNPNQRKSRINDQGLGIGTEAKETLKNFSAISPSNLIGTSAATTIKAWRPADLNHNHRRIKSKTEKFVGQSLSEVDCDQSIGKERNMTYEGPVLKTRGSSFQKADRAESIILLKDKEEKEIKDANDKIRNTIQNSLNISPSASPFTRTNISPEDFMNKTKANITRTTTDKTSILVLFDQDLDFIKDYLIEYQLNLKLVFDKLENYESPAYKKTGDRNVSPLKRGVYLPYHCIFVFLKCSPKVSTKSFAILEELMKVKTCFNIKCCFPSEVGKINFTYKYEDATPEWRRKFEYTLLMLPGRFGTYTINYNHFYVLKEYILTHSRFYLTKDN